MVDAIEDGFTDRAGRRTQSRCGTRRGRRHLRNSIVPGGEMSRYAQGRFDKPDYKISPQCLPEQLPG